MTVRDKCGVVAVFDSPTAARDIYAGLEHLQHRGQESAGMIVGSPHSPFRRHRDLGLVDEVFSNQILDRLSGTMGIGHVRYSTSGGLQKRDAQPLIAGEGKNLIGIAHNGTLTNADELRSALAGNTSGSKRGDTAVALRHIQQVDSADPIEQLRRSFAAVDGAYSMVFQFANGVAALRDPVGFRPLFLGRRQRTTYVASETCALDALDATRIEEIPPGCGVFVTDGGIHRFRLDEKIEKCFCVFEKIYFSRPDSRYDGQPVRQFRFRTGQRLADEQPADVDFATWVPHSSKPAARGFAESAALSLQKTLEVDDETRRSFIAPTPAQRKQVVRAKFDVIADAIAGKKIAVIDDTIVRGTTITHVVQLLRRAGAREVHVRIAAPPLRHPCFFGIDMPRKDAFLHHHIDASELPGQLGADSVEFLSLSGLLAASGKDVCHACLSGEYPSTKPETTSC